MVYGRFDILDMNKLFSTTWRTKKFFVLPKKNFSNLLEFINIININPYSQFSILSQDFLLHYLYLKNIYI